MVGELRVSPAALRDDFEGTLDRLAREGALVWVACGKQRFLLVNEPELVREVLVDRSAELIKPRSQAVETGPPRVEPAPPVDIAAIRRDVTHDLGAADPGEAATAAAAAETAAWRDGAEIEVMPMLRRVAMRTYAPQIDDSDIARFDEVLRWLDASPRVLPAGRFSRHNLRRGVAQQHLATVVQHLGMTSPAAGDLLLGGVGPLSQTAGWLLVRFPEDAARLRAEWPATERTAAFVREVTRLHPTNPRITRAAVADTTVGGEPVPATTRVVLNVNAIARDPRFYDEPDLLLPERWLEGRPHKFAYLSFGLGERRCLGEAFALAALTAILQGLCGGWDIRFGELHETAAGRRQLAEDTRAQVSVC